MPFRVFTEQCNEIYRLDKNSGALNTYNALRPRDHPYHLHEQLGPCPFEGDILKAPVILLLANPCSNDLSQNDHKPNREIVDDWPLWGLHPGANILLQAWWQKRLGALIELFGCQTISQSVAAIQLNPWASQKFDPSVNSALPSRKLMLKKAEVVANQQKLLVVMRSSRLWFKSDIIAHHENKIINQHPICSYVSKGNLGEPNFNRIVSAIKNYKVG